MRSPSASPDRSHLRLGLVAGFAIPGLGHLICGRRLHAALFALCIYGMFAAGMLMSRGTAIDPDHHPVYWWGAQFSAGLPAWIVRWGGLTAEPQLGSAVTVWWHMSGLAWVACSGLCNLVALVDLARHCHSSSIGDAATR